MDESNFGKDLPFSNLSNLAFVGYVKKSQTNNLLPDLPFLGIDHLNSINFNHFIDASDQTNLREHDPDLNFFRNVVGKMDSVYLMEDELKNNVDNINHLNILHLNINSLPQKIDEVKCLVSDKEIGIDFLCLCETKLNNEIQSMCEIDNYKMYTLNKSRNSGGVAIYVGKRFANSFVREDLVYKNDFIECLFIETKDLDNNIIVGVIYRRPNTSIIDFNAKVDDILDSISNENKPCYIMGDFNLDLSKYESSNNVFDFVSLMTGYNFFNCISKPTRVSSNTASIIDHVWTNNISSLHSSYIIYNHLSDHFPILAKFKTNKQMHRDQDEYIKYRDFSDRKIAGFIEALHEVSWDLVYCSQNPQISYNNFELIFKNLYERFFPEIIKKRKVNANNKPCYISNELKSLIHEKEKLQRKYARRPITYGVQYRELRNRVTKELKKAKNKYYRDKLNDCNGNSKETWKVINSIMNKTTKHET